MKPFSSKIHPNDVRELIDFGTIKGQSGAKYRSMGVLQTEGVAALYNILCERNFAYLADEVGMGKTYQALGLASLVWSMNPAARILILCPRENLQKKWVRDYTNFITNNYRRPFDGVGDDKVKSMLLGQPVYEPIICNSVWEFLEYFTQQRKYCLFLRHTSFRRVPVGGRNNSFREIWDTVWERLCSYGAKNYRPLSDRPREEDITRELNFRFATGVRSLLERLGRGEPVIDLLIVDEAQYLRHPENNSNTMIREIFNDQVRKWLFLSATPLHSGPESIKNTVNSYACKGNVFITDEDCSNEPALQKKLQQFLIRRPRTYVVSDQQEEMGKTAYRLHNSEHDGIVVDKALQAMSLALVQKKLVEILEGQNNRFKIGFLSSFESLQDSLTADSRIRKRKQADFEVSDSPNGEEIGEGSDDIEEVRVSRAPDERFISRLTRDFESRFGFPLPHPKTTHLVDSIWRSAFLDDEKHLIFVRRISTVFELERLFERKFLDLVEQRMEQVWGKKDFWEQAAPVPASEDEGETTDSEDSSETAEEGMNPFRKALAKGGWLNSFRRSFRGSGRHAMVFQENWLLHLCDSAGIRLDEFISAVPEDIWRESLAFSRHGKKAHYRASRFQYIVTQIVHRYPEILHLTDDRKAVWQNFFRSIYPDALERKESDKRTKQPIDKELLVHKGFWEVWHERFGEDATLRLALPAAATTESLFQREITKNWIRQFLLLSDTILDFYFAEQKKNEQEFLHCIFDYFAADSAYASLVRKKLSHWITHYDLILKNCFDTSQIGLGGLAAKSNYDELANPRPVVGVTGGNVNTTAIKQFKTPGYPQILVCTDVLKEGEDLHTFCDKVIHYGLAWTAGDLEQRVGRVDRYFSQIERRLFDAADKQSAKLMIYYPHMTHSLEREQVERVVNRQRIAERIMDKSLSIADNDQKEMRQGEPDTVGLHVARGLKNDVYPFRPKEFSRSNPIPTLTREETSRRWEYYQRMGNALRRAAEENGVTVVGNIDTLFEPMDVVVPVSTHPDGRVWKFTLQYVPELESYAMKGTTLSDALEFEEQATKYAFELERVGGEETLRKAIRIFLPLLPQDTDLLSKTFADAFRYLKTDHVKRSERKHQIRELKRAMGRLSLRSIIRQEKENKLTTQVLLGDRKQNISVYLYEGMLFLSSRIGRLNDITIDGRTIDNQSRLLSFNSSMPLGYFSVHDDYLTLCKRIFWHDCDAEFVSKIIFAIAERADAYEMKFLGADRL